MSHSLGFGAFIVVLVICALIFLKLGCHPLVSLPPFAPSKMTGGAGTVTTSADKVSFTPKATKANPHPTATAVPKAPDDRVDVSTDEQGNVDVRVQRLAWILEPTFGVLWNGSLDPKGPDGKDDLGQILEPVFGVRVLKYSNFGTGPLVTPRRFGWGFDWREGNLTGCVGPALKFDGLSLGGVFSVNVVPFD